MDWRSRRAAEGDAPALALVATATFLETFAGILDGEDIVAHCAAKSSVDVFVDWLGDPASVATIAEHPDGAAPVGYTILTAPDLPVATGPSDIELRRIYALLTTRGTGIGCALMASAIADARAMGKARILLGVFGGNHVAHRFYEREGFAVIGERRFLVGKRWCDDLIYARSI